MVTKDNTFNYMNELNINGLHKNKTTLLQYLKLKCTTIVFESCLQNNPLCPRHDVRC